MSEIHKYEVPVDDAWHNIELSGKIVHVDSLEYGKIHFWAYHTSGPDQGVRRFKAFRTGEELPADVNPVYGHIHGSAKMTRSDGQILIFHLVELR
jgi:hypothetical protein